jgi:hypothetical protein
MMIITLKFLVGHNVGHNGYSHNSFETSHPPLLNSDSSVRSFLQVPHLLSELNWLCCTLSTSAVNLGLTVIYMIIKPQNAKILSILIRLRGLDLADWAPGHSVSWNYIIQSSYMVQTMLSLIIPLNWYDPKYIDTLTKCYCFSWSCTV